MEAQVFSRAALAVVVAGITRRYSKSTCPVDLDFTLDFCRTNDLRSCMLQKVNAKETQNNRYHCKYLTDVKMTTSVFSVCKIQFIVFRPFISINTMQYVWNKYLTNKYYLNINIHLLTKCVQCIDSILHSELSIYNITISIVHSVCYRDSLPQIFQSNKAYFSKQNQQKFHQGLKADTNVSVLI